MEHRAECAWCLPVVRGCVFLCTGRCARSHRTEFSQPPFHDGETARFSVHLTRPNLIVRQDQDPEPTFSPGLQGTGFAATRVALQPHSGGIHLWRSSLIGGNPLGLRALKSPIGTMTLLTNLPSKTPSTGSSPSSDGHVASTGTSPSTRITMHFSTRRRHTSCCRRLLRSWSRL